MWVCFYYVFFKIKSTVRYGKAMKNANGVVDKNGILCEAIVNVGI